jgi:hypothetical protein
LGRCSGHSGEFFVQPEVILERNLGRVFGSKTDRDSFLDLDRLMEPFAPMPVREATTGVFVDDGHFVVFDHIVLVAAEAVVSVQRPLDMVVEIVHGSVLETGLCSERGVGIADQAVAFGGHFDFLFSFVQEKVPV